MPPIGNPIFSGALTPILAAPASQVPARLLLSRVPEQLDSLNAGFKQGSLSHAIEELAAFQVVLMATESHVRLAIDEGRPDILENFQLWLSNFDGTIQSLRGKNEEDSLSPLEAQAAVREIKELWSRVDMAAILTDRELTDDEAGGADVGTAAVVPKNEEPSSQSSSSLRLPGAEDFQRTATPLTFFLSQALFKLSSLPAGGRTEIGLGKSLKLGNYAESLRLLLKLDSSEDRSSGAILIAGYLRLMQQHLDAMAKIIRDSKGSKDALESNAVVERSISYLSAQIPTGSEGRDLLADSAEPRTLILRSGEESETITV